eukprot:Gb_34364 [translate_table: standard]
MQLATRYDDVASIEDMARPDEENESKTTMSQQNPPTKVQNHLMGGKPTLRRQNCLQEGQTHYKARKNHLTRSKTTLKRGETASQTKLTESNYLFLIVKGIGDDMAVVGVGEIWVLGGTHLTNGGG